MIQWNLDFYFAVLPLQLLLIFLYFRRRRLPLRDSKAFLGLMVSNLLNIIMDIVASYISMKGMESSLVYFVNVVYYITVICLGVSFFLYVMYASRYEGRGLLRRAVYLFNLFIIGIILSSPWTGLIFTVHHVTGYADGPLYAGIYVSYVIDMMACLYALYRGDPSARVVRNGILVSSALMVGGLLFSLAFREILLVGYFLTLAILIAFLSLRNPELYIHAPSGLFNRTACLLVMDDFISQKKLYAAGMLIRRMYLNRILYGDSFADGLMEGLGLFMNSHFPEVHPFYLRDGRFLFLTQKKEFLDRFMKILQERLEEPWKVGNQEARADSSYFYLGPDVPLGDAYRMRVIFELAFISIGKPGVRTLSIDKEYMKKVSRQVRVRWILEEALARDDLLVYLQPIMEAKTFRLAGAEALVRLQSPEGEIIPPSEFVPAAETSGEVSLLGEQVFRKTCSFIEKGGEKVCGMGWIHVNLAPYQCTEEGLTEKLEEIRKKAAIPIEQIRLEITERGLLGSLGHRQVEKLHEKGYEIVLDDFGSGYSNISRIRSIPLSGIKIDMSLVRTHFKEPDTYLPNIIRTFHEMGYELTAEGVETEEMAKALSKMGCDYLQGYYFSKPLPMDEFVKKYGKQ